MTALALGCEQLGGTDWGAVDAAAARAAVRRAFELGVAIFDTADTYGLGRSEEQLAEALGADRHRVTIVTKGGVRWGAVDASGRASTSRDSSPAYLTSAIEASLRRLRLDVIPLYLVHWPDASTPIDQTLDCLEEARLAGRIRSYGVSNFPFEQVASLAAAKRLMAFEGSFSLLDSPARRAEYVRMRELGLFTLTYGTLAQGLLTGRYSAASRFDETDRRSRLPHFSPEAWAAHEPMLAALGDVARESGRSHAQVALRWVIESGAADAVIVGARAPAQVDDFMQARDWSLPPGAFDRLAASRTHAAPGVKP